MARSSPRRTVDRDGMTVEQLARNSQATVWRTTEVYVKRHPTLAVLMFISIALLCLAFLRDSAWSIYGYVAFSILGTKLFLSLLPPKKWKGRVEDLPTVGVVVTVYNEDPAFLRQCLDSLIVQSCRPTRIVVIDDCSNDLASLEVAQEYERHFPGVVTAVRQEVNKGKREGLARGFRIMQDDCEVFLGVDSDTILEYRAVENGLRPFLDPKITASTGVVLAANHEKNMLSRIIDVRYINAFLTERAAYSRLGSVLCVCGSLAFYRATSVLPRLDGFLNQMFLGQKATVGDDRHLTNLCLLDGRVVLVENSICHTVVPEKVNHYLRQQVRWGRSFFRESLWVLQNRKPSCVPWWLTLVELGQWFVLTIVLVYMIAIHPFLTGDFNLWEYLVFVALMAVSRSVRYFDVVRPTQSMWSVARSFAVTPLFGFLTFFVVMPMRVWALCSLKNTRWGTRKAVEVSLADAPAEKSTKEDAEQKVGAS